MKTFKVFSIIAGMALILSSCAKDGATGPQGATGPAGANGTNGSSNVSITSVTVSPGNWNANGSYNWYYNTTVSIPTTDVCNIYVSTNGINYYPLPFGSVYYSGDELTYNYATGYYIQLTYSNPSATAISTTLYYNIADIPPAMIQAHPNTNWQNWSEVNVIIQNQKDTQ